MPAMEPGRICRLQRQVQISIDGHHAIDHGLFSIGDSADEHLVKDGLAYTYMGVHGCSDINPFDQCLFSRRLFLRQSGCSVVV